MEHAAAMLMLCVTIPKDLTSVRANTDFMEMAKIALVTVKIYLFV